MCDLIHLPAFLPVWSMPVEKPMEQHDGAEDEDDLHVDEDDVDADEW